MLSWFRKRKNKMTNKEQEASENELNQDVENKEETNSSNQSASEEEEKVASSENETKTEASREKELAKELEDTKRRYLTALADYQNLQKRTAKVQAESRDRGVGDFLKKLLPVMDTLDKVMEICAKSDLDKKVMDGLEMFSIQFTDMLAKEGLKEIEAMGKKFDPNCQEAMMNQSNPDKEDDEVIQVFEKGYTFKDHVLRCAKVVVNKK